MATLHSLWLESLGFRPFIFIGGGDYAILRHQGPYTNLHKAYRWLFGEWLAASGRELSDQPPFEIYHNNPNEVPPEELLTDIHAPLKSWGI